MLSTMGNSPYWIITFLFSSLVFEVTLGDQRCNYAKNDGESCEQNGSSGVCFNQKCFVTSPSKAPVLVKIRYQQDNTYARSSGSLSPKMFLRGNGLGLTWHQGKQMNKSSEKDTWEYSLEYTIPSSSMDSDEKSLGRFEFRVFLDDITNMLGANFRISLPLSSSTDNVGEIPVFLAHPWFFSKKGTVKQRKIFSPELDQNRNITVYMPPSFVENKYKKYETLFVNDGQFLMFAVPQFDILSVDKALIKEILVIGIHNNFSERSALLAPSNGTEAECRNGNLTNLCDGCVRCSTAESRCTNEERKRDYQCFRWVNIPEVHGRRYLDFVQDTLILEVKKSYRALPDAENFGIMGYSLGGLSACHAFWTRPDAFGSAACMSPSLWWPFPENGTYPDDARYEFLTSTLRRHLEGRPRQKLYVDVGLDEGAIMIEPARNTTSILADTKYFDVNENLWFYVWDDHDHNFERALDRLWTPLIALYGAEGAPGGTSSDEMTSGQTEIRYHAMIILITLYIIAFN